MKVLRQIISISLMLVFSGSVSAQEHFREDIRYLCSEDLAGRGYVNDGLNRAAAFIAAEFEEAGLETIGGSWFQPFRMSVNTFPSAMEVKVGGRTLNGGEEYLVKASSASLRGTFPLKHVLLKDLNSDSAFTLLSRGEWSAYLLVLDTMTYEDERIDKRYKSILHNKLRAKGIVVKSKRRLIWTVARDQAAFFTLECLPEVVHFSDSFMSVDVRAKFNKQFRAKNVWAQVRGTLFPDSFLVISAHYDHLGKMGKSVMFPGANDNASGTAMMLELARYYAKNPQPFTVVFVAFTAEEAGLVGSKYFTENPPIPLKSIRFLMNLDLEGTGKDGITAVNATIFEQEFRTLQAVNDSGKFLVKIVPRGKAANSDHYWFSEAGVPCFFIYQMGEYGHYHDPGDQAEKLPLDAFMETQELIRAFFDRLQSARDT
ncbi:MAG: M28 family metallopeptidase [Bacteroidia bacterium]